MLGKVTQRDFLKGGIINVCCRKTRGYYRVKFYVGR